jgi:hypothetical protein
MAVNYGTSIYGEGLTFCVDAGNPGSWSQNVHPNPLDIYAWASPGGASQMTLSKDTSLTSPAGGMPLKMVTTGTAGYIGTYNSPAWNLAAAANGQTWTVSFWVKGSSAFTASMLIFEANSSGVYITYGQTYYNVTTEWSRVTGTYTFTNASAAFVQARIDCYVNGVSLWVDGMQVEQSSTSTTFNSKSNPSRTWSDLGPNQINLTPTGTINYTTYGGVTCFGFNSSMYWESTTAKSQTTDYRYGSTIELWLYNQTKSVRKTVFEKAGNTYASYEQEIAMTWEVANDISAYRAYNAYDFSSSTGLNNNAWNHCVMVLGPHLSSGQWYLNGVAAGSYTQRAVQLPPQANQIRIGTGYAGTMDTGGVAVVRTYRTMFDASDIAQLYANQKTRFGL